MIICEAPSDFLITLATDYAPLARATLAGLEKRGSRKGAPLLSKKDGGIKIYLVPFHANLRIVSPAHQKMVELTQHNARDQCDPNRPRR